MTITPPATRPKNVSTAVQILWLWLLSIVLSGFYEAKTGAPQIAQALPPEISFSQDAIFLTIIGCYAFIALSMIGVVMQIWRGRNWARWTLLFGLLIDVVIAYFSSFDSTADYVMTGVDTLLQLCALWLVFIGPGRHWFYKRG